MTIKSGFQSVDSALGCQDSTPLPTPFSITFRSPHPLPSFYLLKFNLLTQL